MNEKEQKIVVAALNRFITVQREESGSDSYAWDEAIKAAEKIATDGKDDVEDLYRLSTYVPVVRVK